MCTVGCFGWNSAIPRLPRVMSTRLHARAPQQRPARPLEHVPDRRRCECRATCSTSDSFGVQVVSPRIVEQPIAAVDQDRDARRRRVRAIERAANDRGERRRDETRAVVGQQHGVAVGEGRHQLRRERAARRRRASGQPASRSMRTTCCFAEWTPPARIRVLTGVRYSRRAHDARAIDAAVKARRAAAALRRRRRRCRRGRRGRRAPRHCSRRCRRRRRRSRVASYLRISTGASRETRATSP